MHIAAAEEALLDGNHVRAFVSEANHNTYPQPVYSNGRPMLRANRFVIGRRRYMTGRGAPRCWRTPTASDVAAIENNSPRKILNHGCNWCLHFYDGGAAGIHCGWWNTIPPPIPPLGGGDKAETDPEGLILAPTDLVYDFQGDAATVRPWAGTPQQRVFDERWETTELSWGPPALQDPFRRRQGRAMPRYIGPFISALGRHLEENG